MRKLLLLGVIALGVVAPSVGFGAIVDFKNTGNGVWSTGIAPSNVVLTPSAGGTLNAQVDSHYTLVKLPTGCAGVTCQETNLAGDLFGPATYIVLGGNGTYPLVSPGGWTLQNDANSSWIGPRADQRNPQNGGTTYDNTAIFGNDTDFFVYRMVFNLTALGINPATASINLSWLSDNSTGVPSSNAAHIRMCSIASASDPVCGAGNAVPTSGNAGEGSGTMTTVNIASGFASNLMALDFVVYNAVLPGFGRNPAGMRVVVNSATGDDGGPPPSGVPEPGTIGLMAIGLLGIYFGRRK